MCLRKEKQYFPRLNQDKYPLFVMVCVILIEEKGKLYVQRKSASKNSHVNGLKLQEYIRRFCLFYVRMRVCFKDYYNSEEYSRENFSV